MQNWVSLTKLQIEFLRQNHKNLFFHQSRKIEFSVKTAKLNFIVEIARSIFRPKPVEFSTKCKIEFFRQNCKIKISTNTNFLLKSQNQYFFVKSVNQFFTRNVKWKYVHKIEFSSCKIQFFHETCIFCQIKIAKMRFPNIIVKSNFTAETTKMRFPVKIKKKWIFPLKRVFLWKSQNGVFLSKP